MMKCDFKCTIKLRKTYLRLLKKNYVGILQLVFVLLCMASLVVSCGSKANEPIKIKKAECEVFLPKSVDSLEIVIQNLKERGDNACLISAYGELGKAYNSKNRFAKSIVSYLKGLEVLKSVGDTVGIVHFLNEIAQNSQYVSDYNQASYYYYKAINYSKSYSKRDEKAMMQRRIQTLNGMGHVFMQQENWSMADSAYRTALDCETKLDNLPGRAACYSYLGHVYESTNNIDSAWSYYRKSMVYSVESQSQYGMAMCHLHFGQLYEKEGNLHMALREYYWANELLSKSKEKWRWVESCIAIARVYLAQKDERNVFHYLEMAKKTAKELKSVQYLADIYQLYYKWYLQVGDSKQALDNYVLSTTYADSVMNLVKLNQMYNIRLQFMEGSHQNELQSMTSNYTNEKDSRHQLLKWFIISSVVVSVILLVLLSYLQSKRKMADVMKKMECMRSDFFTNVTHEFRTPLTVILGLGEQLENGLALSKEELTKMGSVISYQGNQLLNLVNQLLDVSKIQSSLGTPRWCRGNIITYIDMLVENFQEVVRKKHLELVFISQDKEIEMDFISDYMDKIMRNLMSNAYKFTPEYGKIYITASAEKEELVIYVADTGQGISDADKPYIFDSFYQGDNKSFSVGTGIGLSLVHQLVQAMNGTIDVKSSTNEGTVFIMRFPLKRKYSKGEEYDVYSSKVHKNRQNVAVDEDDLPDGKAIDDVSPLILIVEDNTDVAYYIGSQLQRNYTLKYARNGRVGLEIAEELVPDAIITDLIMPEMNGYDLCRAVRNSKQLNHIPVILLSVLNSNEERIKGLEAGADAYLCKPFNSRELNERLEYLLGQRRMLRQKFTQEQEDMENAAISEADQQFLNKLTDITYSVMSTGNVTVEDIASKMLMSRQQINRKVHALTGENTVNYITRIRLNRAKMLLDSPKDYYCCPIKVFPNKKIG